jgi:hypothetical protein
MGGRGSSFKKAGGGSGSIDSQISSIDKQIRKVWASGMDEAIRRLQPKQILCYGSEIDYDFKGIPVRQFDEPDSQGE